MFEKEAEEKSVVYVDKLAKERHFEKGTSYTVGLEEGYDDGFKDGSEYAYNKANEWHYVNDELPEKKKYVLIYTNVGNVYISRLVKDDYFINKKGGFVQTSAVIAWKEIVLPELKGNKNG